MSETRQRCLLGGIAVLGALAGGYALFAPQEAADEPPGTSPPAAGAMGNPAEPFPAEIGTADLPVPDGRIAVPPEILDPVWMESRRQAQLATRDQFDVFYEFQFEDRVERSGIQFVHQIVDDAGKHHKPVHYDHGNGLAAADVDRDGLIDLYFLSQLGRNELWRNRGDGTFEDVTDAAGVALANWISVSAAFADVDNDGDADLYVTTVRNGNVLYENDGSGRFRDMTAESGLGYVGHSSAPIFFDYDRDGLLDLFLCNVGVYTTEEQGRGGYYVGFQDAFAGHLKEERNEPSLLFRNIDGRHFVNVTEDVRLRDESWNGDACPIDVNADGWIDLYVLNMQGHDHYYENVEGKYFEDKSREIFPKTPWGAMGVAACDYDNDGDFDLFVTDMHSDMSRDILVDPQSEISIDTFFEEEKEKSQMRYPESLLQSGGMSIYGNALYRNRGDGTFDEVSDELGAENYWPWGLSIGDLNADGFEDAFITASMNYPYRYGVNTVLLNNRGRRFLDSEFLLGVEPRRNGRTAKPWFELDCSGEDRNHRHCEGRTGRLVVWGALGSRSSVLLDIENDGDLDVVTNEFHDGPMVLVSNLTDRKPIRFLKIRLIGHRSNRSGFGARVSVRAGDNTYVQMHDGKSGYLSQSLLPLYFGLDEADQVDAIEVRWPSGQTQSVDGPIETNQLLDIREPSE